jgi:hypothetical protein
MSNAVTTYQPTEEHLFLADAGLLLQDQEDTVSHRRRVGWREDESWTAFVARKRRDRTDAASSVLRQDAADGGRSVAHGAGHDEPEEEAPDAEAARKGMLARSHKEPAEDKEPDAGAAYKALCDKRRDGWKAKRDAKPMDAANERQRMLDRRFGKKS